jgi:hypothetical protein
MTVDPFWRWLDEGIEAGFCSQPVCNTHDGLPSTEEEDRDWEDGGDPCVPAVRLYYDQKPADRG